MARAKSLAFEVRGTRLNPFTNAQRIRMVSRPPKI